MVTAETQKVPYMAGTLTGSDLELIKQLCLPNKIISRNLGISPAAVSMQVARIDVKLGVENRTAIVVRALELNLITIDQLVYRNYEEPNLSGTNN